MPPLCSQIRLQALSLPRTAVHIPGPLGVSPRPPPAPHPLHRAPQAFVSVPWLLHLQALKDPQLLPPTSLASIFKFPACRIPGQTSQKPQHHSRQRPSSPAPLHPANQRAHWRRRGSSHQPAPRPPDRASVSMGVTGGSRRPSGGRRQKWQGGGGKREPE